MKIYVLIKLLIYVVHNLQLQMNPKYTYSLITVTIN